MSDKHFNQNRPVTLVAHAFDGYVLYMPIDEVLLYRVNTIPKLHMYTTYVAVALIVAIMLLLLFYSRLHGIICIYATYLVFVTNLKLIATANGSVCLKIT